MFEYVELLQRRLEVLINCNAENMKKVIGLFSGAILNNRMIHIFGTGHSHMIGLEGFIRAGGLGNINAILDSTVTTSDGALRSSSWRSCQGWRPSCGQSSPSVRAM